MDATPFTETIMKQVKTVADFSNAAARQSREIAKLQNQRYILTPALQQNLARFDKLKDIADPKERRQYFREIPALGHDLLDVYKKLGPRRRTSLAQQARARNARVRFGPNLQTMRVLVATLNSRSENCDKSAKQLWLSLLEELKALGLRPQRIRDVSAKERCQYDAGPLRLTISEGRFANILSSLRCSLPK